MELTREQLKQFDGKEGRRAYIGYDGRIYDVTDSFLWKGGRHQALHEAGQDLTKVLDLAPHGATPHGADLLARVPVIGILVE